VYRPLVSILTPTFNHAPFIESCVESVRAQTYQRWEMVVIDDGSTDGTDQRIGRFDDERIVYLRQQHRGIHALGETYATALRRCRGELVAILEGDDFWPQDKLATLVPLFDDREVVLAYGVTRVVGTDGVWHGATIPDRQRMTGLPLANDPVGSAARALLPPDPLFVFPVSTIVRRAALDAIGGFRTVDDGHSVDWATFLALALRGRFAFVDRPMGFWRRHDEGTTATWNFDIGYAEADRRFVFAFLAEHGERLGVDAAASRALRRRWAHFLASLNCLRGRRLLVERDWSTARLHLRRALRSGAPRVAATSALALAASLFHSDIERFLPSARDVHRRG